jgi:heme-degrading monooxygenase HmoA
MAGVAIAATSGPPYYMAVITVERTEADDGYLEMADAMYQLAAAQPGFLGMEWVYDAGRRAGITSSYWTSADAIAAWKQQAAFATQVNSRICISSRETGRLTLRRLNKADMDNLFEFNSDPEVMR